MVETLGPKVNEPAHVKLARIIRNVVWFGLPLPYIIFTVVVMRLIETGAVNNQGVSFLDDQAYPIMVFVVALIIIFAKLLQQKLFSLESIIAAYPTQYRQLSGSMSLRGEALRYFVVSQSVMIKSIVLAALLDSAAIIGLGLALVTADTTLALVSGLLTVIFAFLYKPDFDSLVREVLLRLPADPLITTQPPGEAS